jgi:Ca2+-binding EF-hand superfamily protein
MRNSSTAVPLFLVALLAAATYAGDEKKQVDTVRDTIAPDFTDIDADQDGIISMDEAKGTWLADAFTIVDANQDGAIDEKEYSEAMS